MPRPLRFAVFGAGFWARCQLAAWREVNGVTCVAIYNRTRPRAEALAAACGIPAVFDDPVALLEAVRPDFIDNITEVGGHLPLSLLCARHRVPCICQKPMAGSLADARRMVGAFQRAKTPFLVHENWRWQAPLRQLGVLLASEIVGTPLRARLTMVSGFDVFGNQPALRTLDHFILMDLGSHLLDVSRALFGEARTLACRTSHTLHHEVAGENLATLLLTMGPAATHVVIELGYTRTPLEPGRRELFPQTLAFVEGTNGSIELAPDCTIRVTTRRGTRTSRHAPLAYPWVDAAYALVQASIVPCNIDLLAALRGRRRAETTGSDNLKTMALVFAAYKSARTGRTIAFPS
ncbi:MAG: gfo/Idh/MocA family oxidoreductase [Luteitalea sp.]|nr:gfo/Idh/MocA family oxidoreductase [Luteitalea sp.]